MKLPKLSPFVQKLLALIVVSIALLYPFSYFISNDTALAKNRVRTTYSASESARLRAKQKTGVQNRVRLMLDSIQDYGNKLNQEMAKGWSRYID